MSYLLLIVHIAAGTLALGLGAVVIGRDTWAGRPVASRAAPAYRWTVLVVCLSAVGLVLLKRTDLGWLIPVSGLTYGLAVLARAAAGRRFHGWSHAYTHGYGGSYIALVTALIVVSLVVNGPMTGAAQLIPWLAPTVLGTPLIEIWRRRLVAPTTAKLVPTGPGTPTTT